MDASDQSSHMNRNRGSRHHAVTADGAAQESPLFCLDFFLLGKKQTNDEAHVHRPFSWFGCVLLGACILIETQKQNATKKCKYNVHPLHRRVTVALCHRLGGKLKVVKPTRIGTAMECSRVEHGRVTLHLESCSHEQVLRWGRLRQTHERKHSAQLHIFQKKTVGAKCRHVTTDLSLEVSDRNLSE